MDHPTQQWLNENEPGEVKLNAAAKALSFTAGPANDITSASHRYVIEGFDTQTNPEAVEGEPPHECVLLFQNGVVPEVGVNGITPEILIDVLIHRFEGFQTGRFACAENAKALEGFKMAKQAMQERTQGRIARHVEGTHTL